MQRLNDWPKRLTKFIEASRKRPFVWGEHDCALFTFAACEAMTGDDPLRHVRGTYASAYDARRVLLRDLGVWNLDGLATRLLGQPIPVNQARRGDVALIDAQPMPALGVVIGGQVAFPGLKHLMFVDLSRCIKAWSLGW